MGFKKGNRYATDYTQYNSGTTPLMKTNKFLGTTKVPPILAVAGGLLLSACLIFWYFAPISAVIIEGTLIETRQKSQTCPDCLSFAVSNSSKETLIGKTVQLLGDPEKINPLKQIATPNTSICFEAREHIVDIGKENLRLDGVKMVLEDVIDNSRCRGIGK